MKIPTTYNAVVSIPLDHHKRTLKPSISRLCFHQRDPISIPRRLTAAAIGVGGGYMDEGHLEYYDKVRERKTRRGKREKRRMELVDCLVKDLSALSELGSGVDDEEEEVGDSKAKIVSEAAEMLLAQLMQLRDTEKMKEEKEKKEKKVEKRKMKMTKTKVKPDCESSSSSSSSESSSDNECDQVVDMAQLKRGLTLPPAETLFLLDSQGAVNESSVTVNLASEEPLNALNLEDTCCNSICDSPSPAVLERNSTDQPVETADCSKMLQLQSPVGNVAIDRSTSSRYGGVEEVVNDAASSLAKKVEVCMGGKCKKLGAPALMEEFQRVLGGEAAVVACKCLGKCKSAPNVRVLQNSEEMDESGGNPLCIGVSLDDVGVIAANYIVAGVKDYGVIVA